MDPLAIRDIVGLIAHQLDVVSLVALARVNRRLNAILRQNPNYQEIHRLYGHSLGLSFRKMLQSETYRPPMGASLWLVNHLPEVIMAEFFFQIACWNGHLKIAQRYINLNLLSPLQLDQLFKITCRYGHLEVCQWLHQHYPPTNVTRLYQGYKSALEGGHLPIIQWLAPMISPPLLVDLIIICQYGHDDIFDWYQGQWPTQIQSLHRRLSFLAQKSPSAHIQQQVHGTRLVDLTGS